MPSTSNSSSSHSTRSSARSATNSHAVRVIARSGYAVNGLLHILIGVIALQLLLTGGESTDADQSGALQSLASTQFGGILLWIVTIGLAMLGLWLIVDGILQGPARDSKKKLVVGIVKGLVYLALASTASQTAMALSCSGYKDGSPLGLVPQRNSINPPKTLPGPTRTSSSQTIQNSGLRPPTKNRGTPFLVPV